MNGTLLQSEVCTATAESEPQVSSRGQRGVMLVLDITDAPAAADTLTLAIQAKDPATGKYVTLTAFTASKKGEELEAGATLTYTIYPGGAETAAVGSHEIQALPLPSRWRALVTHSAGGSWTYTLGSLALS